jgi:pyrroloquinoline quinone (PQQ) biosynthesis protein C
VELFERFAQGVGAAASATSPAMSALLATYGELVNQGAQEALASFVAYEHQAAAVAGTKASTLRTHYALSDSAVEFWEHHAEVDVRHGEWALDALDSIASAPEDLGPWVRRAADAWWEFLDERELSPQPL